MCMNSPLLLKVRVHRVGDQRQLETYLVVIDPLEQMRSQRQAPLETLSAVVILWWNHDLCVN